MSLTGHGLDKPRSIQPPADLSAIKATMKHPRRIRVERAIL